MLASVTTLYELCDYEPVFGTNSGCDCHFSGDNRIIQKERLSVTGWCSHGSLSRVGSTLCGLLCRVDRVSTGRFGLNGSR